MKCPNCAKLKKELDAANVKIEALKNVARLMEKRPTDLEETDWKELEKDLAKMSRKGLEAHYVSAMYNWGFCSDELEELRKREKTDAEKIAVYAREYSTKVEMPK